MENIETFGEKPDTKNEQLRPLIVALPVSPPLKKNPKNILIQMVDLKSGEIRTRLRKQLLHS
jgi:hypothetical protein